MKKQQKEVVKIGEIAKELGILTSRVRYYTQIGLIKEASRTQGRYRLYKKDETISQLKEILRLKKGGLSLEEIKRKIKSGKVPGTLIDHLKGYPVKFMYLFGSCAKAEDGRLADIDIAIFLDEGLSENERFEMRLKLMVELAKIFKTDKVDLVVLNDSPLLLCFNVIKPGVVLHSVDEQSRIKFEAKVMSKYFDQQYYYKRHTEATINRIALEGII